ncbi:putative glucosamine 6-phosphate acetyltransferase [Mollisia scopiformis]|uniref:Glucosamine 6-phosphate N-acetyltransferase n=1 Tax=Mollisia scopiformis TaxID=149040 RepID=A0A194XTV2_MOLSC|nr:putative glucosamine 6-phosphate acetyltransferase [Mollisia scopiformis]KUJ23638.1 putative glucosamine 6-phosphate acetyltransferase [Mollisia scopiformis]
MAEVTNTPNGTAVPVHTSTDLKTTPSITMTAPTDSEPVVNGEPAPTTNGTTETKSEPAVEQISASEEGMFGPELVSPTIAASLPTTYTIRALRKSDYSIGFLDVLRVLTTVGDITEEEWNGRYDWMTTQGKGGYYLLVVEDQGRIVATGALLVERKFIHHLGLVGHIEDIAVAKDQQGKKLGLKLIQALDFIAEKVGCYKCILDCSEANEGFYVKCGYKRAGLEMAHYYDGSTRSHL